MVLGWGKANSFIHVSPDPNLEVERGEYNSNARVISTECLSIHIELSCILSKTKIMIALICSQSEPQSIEWHFTFRAAYIFILYC